MLHNSFIKYCIVALIVMMAFGTQAKKKEKVKVDPSYAWTMSDPLGLQYPAGIDTLYENYHDNAIPSFRSKAFATTGNYGNAGQDQISSTASPQAPSSTPMRSTPGCHRWKIIVSTIQEYR